MNCSSIRRAVFARTFRARTLAAVVAACLFGAAPLARAEQPSADAGATNSTDNDKDNVDKRADKAVVLKEVPVTAQAEQVAPTAAFTESVISADVVRNLSPGPSMTVQTMLNFEPSIFAYANGPLGVETTINFRAFNSSQFAETYAGVALNDVFNGGVTNQAENRNNVLITPNNLGSVQIYRGINNPSVNSYNSLGGTINFIPRQPGDVQANEFGVNYGSFGSFGWHATVDTGDWNGVRQIFSFEQNGSDGWIDNTSDRNNNFYWGLTWSPNDGNHFYNYLLYNKNNGYSPFNMPVPLLQQYGDNYQWPKSWTSSPIRDTNWMDILGWKADFAANIHFENKFFFGRNEYLRNSYSNPLHQQSDTAHGDFSQPYGLEDTPAGGWFWQYNPSGPTYDPVTAFGSPQNGTQYHFYGYTAEGIGDTPTLTLELPHNLVTIGGNITYGKLHSREYWYGSLPVPQIDGYNDTWDEHDHRTLSSIFVQDEITLFDDKLRITPGVKYIYAKTTDHDVVGIYYPIAGTVQDTEHFTSPTLGLNYEITEGLNVYAGYGKNIKLPDISAYYGAFQYDGNGNPTIAPVRVKPEYVNDYELGLRYQISGFSAALNGYRENFQNTFQSVLSQASGLTSFFNGGSSRYQGVELQLKQDFGSFSFGDLSSYLNYAHNQAKFTSSFTSDYAGPVSAGQPLAGVPKNLLSVGLLWKWDGWRINLDGRYVGKQYTDQLYVSEVPIGDNASNTIKAYTVFNLGISKTFTPDIAGLPRQFRISLNVDNLLDRRYLNTAYTDSYPTGTDALGNPDDYRYFLRGIMGAPRSVMGSLSFDF